nr:hypothetical protein CFP56_43923 [Quercus suber]POE85608.1 hypothetical protein CFP56_43925 [Quercus suber]
MSLSGHEVDAMIIKKTFRDPKLRVSCMAATVTLESGTTGCTNVSIAPMDSDINCDNCINDRFDQCLSSAWEGSAQSRTTFDWVPKMRWCLCTDQSCSTMKRRVPYSCKDKHHYTLLIGYQRREEGRPRVIEG